MATISSEEKTLALLAHLGGLSGYIIPFGGILVPLIIWQIKKDTMPFVVEESKESLNFQISMVIYSIISAILMFVLIGFLLIFVVTIANVILCIVAAIKANSGEHYKYPFTIRFIK